MRAEPFSTQTIRTVLEEVFPAGDSMRIVRVEAGVSTWVYAIDWQEERFYLRILPEQDSTFAPEVQAHTLARLAGAKVPDVLYYQPRPEGIGHSVMLTTAIPGRPIDRLVPQSEAAEIVKEAGRDLARIHTVPVDGFGWVLRDSHSLPEKISAGSASFYDAYLDELEQHLFIIEQYLSSVLEVSRIRVVIHEGCAKLKGEYPYLAHGDFDTSHIFADSSGYTGIIDFGEIRGAPKLYDLAHHYMHDRERLPYSTLPYLIQGYTEISSLPDDYRHQLRGLSLLIACRALSRGLQRDPASMIVGTAASSIRRVLAGVDIED